MKKENLKKKVRKGYSAKFVSCFLIGLFLSSTEKAASAFLNFFQKRDFPFIHINQKPTIIFYLFSHYFLINNFLFLCNNTQTIYFSA